MLQPVPVRICLRALSLATVLGLLAAASAFAHKTNTGGAAAPVRPEVAEALCAGERSVTCAEGEDLKLTGEYLDTTRSVVFLGKRGRQDDRKVTPSARSPHRVVVEIPSAAPSGRVRVVSPVAGASSAGPRVRVVDAPAQEATELAATDDPTAFPVRGKYDFGTETNRFGGGRNHKGQDVFAACRTPVAAALSGTVTIAKWHDAAGNYAVIKAKDGTSQAYMHLLKPASVGKGQKVTAGQQIGLVGETGRASGCHLHFELWTAPGWYQGGEAVDPLPSLREWARADAAGK
jgi:murein DD-endopeptidase MepM/ murein hydrolase activator NlpD